MNGNFPGLNSLSLSNNEIDSVRECLFCLLQNNFTNKLQHVTINEFTIAFVF